MPFSNMQINPAAGYVPSFGNLNAQHWSLNSAMPSQHRNGLGAFGGILANAGIGLGAQFLGNLASGLISQAFAKRNMRLQTEAQKELFDYQLDKQYDFMNREQEIRKNALVRAGISPATMNGHFSQGQVGNIGSAGMPSSGGMQGVDPMTAMMVAMQMKKNDAEVGVLNAQKNALNSDARKNLADARVTEGYGASTASQNIQNMKAQVRHLDADIAYLNEKTKSEPIARKSIFKQIDLSDKQIWAIDRQYDIEYKKLEPTIRSLVANAFLASESARNQRAQANRSNELLEGDLTLQGGEIRKLNQEVVNLATENHLKGENILYLAALREKAMAEKNWIQKKAAEQEFHNEVLRLCGPELFYDREKMQNMNLRLDNINKGIQAVDNGLEVGHDLFKTFAPAF